MSEHTEQGRGRLRAVVRRWFLRGADAVLVNGESGADYIERFGVPASRIFRVPYTTEMVPFAAIPATRTDDAALRLIYAGELIERKGLVPFLATLARWGTDHPDRDVDFWLVGDGPLRVDLERTHLPANVSLKLLGTVGYDELPRVYSQAGIFVLPTLADEWAVVVNEALAAGLPVLGSVYSQAVEELVRDDVAGEFDLFGAEGSTAPSIERSRRLAMLSMRCVCTPRMPKPPTPADAAERIAEAIRHVAGD